VIPAPHVHTALTRGQQQRLADSIARMAESIASGRCRPPSLDALQRIADLCDEYFLYAEAARVRRWMAP
jgi:hypothetical protein